MRITGYTVKCKHRDNINIVMKYFMTTMNNYI